MKIVEIKNSYLAVQISQNHSPISFQLSVKTAMTFCSIWSFPGNKWVISPGSKITWSQLRLGTLFQRSSNFFLIFADFRKL